MLKTSLPTMEILAALYRPNLAYLKVQLQSLNAQDYPSLRILLLDDSADAAIHQGIAALAAQTLTDHPYRLLRNDTNLGVTRTFAKLTELAEGELLAYCDQDDDWRPEKGARLAALLEDPKNTLAYSNQSIIDGAGRETYHTLQNMNPRFTHRWGGALFPYFLTDNCVTGCTMVVRSDVAKAALPFPDAYVHDHWLALCASAQGSIAYDPTPLIGYRLHGGNVIGMRSLAGVTDRESYAAERLMPELHMLDAAGARFPDPEQQAEIRRQRKTQDRRLRYVGQRRVYLLPALVAALWRDPLRLGLEGLLGLLPEALGRRVVAFAKRH